MKLTKNIIITLIITLISVGSVFASADRWEDDKIDSKEYGYSFYLTIFENGLKQKNIGIILPSDECDSYDSLPMNAPSIYINNKKVQMMAQCTAKGIRMDFPKTSAGRKYVINELKTKNEVVYRQGKESVTFSAKGFTKAYNSFESTSDGL